MLTLDNAYANRIRIKVKVRIYSCGVKQMSGEPCLYFLVEIFDPIHWNPFLFSVPLPNDEQPGSPPGHLSLRGACLSMLSHRMGSHSTIFSAVRREMTVSV